MWRLRVAGRGRSAGPWAQADVATSLSCRSPSSSRAIEWSAAAGPWATTLEAWA